MRPVVIGLNDNLIKQCELETQKLFELFLDVSECKYQTQETNEVQYQVRQRDSQVRSGSLSSSSALSSSYGSNISLRGHGDLSYYKEAIEKKRRSLEVPIPARCGSSPALNTLETDSTSVPTFSMAQPRSKSAEKKRAPRPRPPSGPPTYAPFPTEENRRRSRSNTGPSEEQLLETANTIAAIGDNIEKEHQERLNKLQTQMLGFLTDNVSISYELFAAHVNEMVGQDRNFTNLMFIMHLGKRVVQSSRSVGSQTRTFFARFVGHAFGEEVARSGSANEYVHEHSKETDSSQL